MEIFNSKVDVEALTNIEINVVKLIIRLSEEEGAINDEIKVWLLKALQIYIRMVNKEKDGRYISTSKTCKIKELICAKIKLEEFARTEETQSDLLFTTGTEPQEVKNRHFELNRIVQTRTLCPTEWNNLWKMISSYTRTLNRNTRLLKPKEEEQISNLLINLFIISSPSQIPDILDASVDDLNRIWRKLEKLNLENINSSNVEKISETLKQVNLKINTINNITTNVLKSIENENEKTLLFYDDERPLASEVQVSNNFDSNLLKKVKQDLQECDMIIEKFLPPTYNIISIIKNRVITLVHRHLGKLRSNSADVLTEKHALIEQRNLILNKVDNIDSKNRGISEKLENLRDLNDSILTTVESNVNFNEKIISLQTIQDKINKIDEDNQEICLQKTDINNRLTGYINIESANYLRQLKKILDTFEAYAHQFAFCGDSEFYNKKVEEICLFENHLKELSGINSYSTDRTAYLRQYCCEILKILRIKAAYNDLVIACLKKLENAEHEMEQLSTTSIPTLDKLNSLNYIREKMNSINNFHKKVTSKKLTIYSKIHKIEDDIYETNMAQFLKKIKFQLNQFEKNVIFDHIKDDAILFLYNKMFVPNKENNPALKYIKQIDTIFQLIFQTFINKSEEKMKNKNRKKLEIIRHNILHFNELNSQIKDLTFIKMQKKLIKSLRLSDLAYEELIKLKIDLDKKISSEIGKLELAEYNKNLVEISNNINMLSQPVDKESFETNLYKLSSIKDLINDLPEEDSDLHFQKQKSLKELDKIFQRFDEDLHKFMQKQKNPEIILDLQSCFDDFDLENKNNVDFLKIVRSKAENFEDSVKYNIDLSYSVDYYVIHEKLMRLLEALDRLDFDDDEKLPELVKTVNYIKNLISLLSSSAA